jgi:hypothetical protein
MFKVIRRLQVNTGSSRPSRRRSHGLRVERLEDRSVPAAFSFTTGSPDGLMATASRPSSGPSPEIESADDLILASETRLTQATVTGLLPTNAGPSSIADLRVEIYRVFPFDSNPSRTIKVPTRTNSPSDVEFTDRDSRNGSLDFGLDVLSSSFTAANSVLNGIHPAPKQTTGGDGKVSGEEVQLQISFNTLLDLPAGHYFFVPQVRLTSGNFYWLSAPSKQFNGDLQEWIRNEALQPDWLRVGTDIVGGATPPTFDAAFSLSGTTVTPDFTFTTGSPDGRMATASQPSVGGQTEIESADDFILANETNLTQATVTGLLPAGISASAITDVRVEIYRVFPFDSNPSRTIKVPTRTNSPSDVEFTDRDSSNDSLSFGFDVLSPSFTAANSVLKGIHPAPKQSTGGDGPVTGEEAQFQITFNTPLDLPAGHYFFVPQVHLSGGGHFYWLSTPSKQFSGDLQEWIRNEALQPDWLRVGTDIVGGATPPTFDAAFSLSGTTVTPNFTFTTGSPDGRMATASQPSVGGQTEIESADDFILANETNLTQATVTGLLPAGINASAITDVRVEIYRVFPFDSNPSRTIKVPTRTNSPSDVEFTDRDSSNGSLSFGFDVLDPSFTAANSVLNGIHAAPHQTTGGDGKVSGEEVQFQITFNTPLDLPAGHYFFVPQVHLSGGGHFYWLSTPSTQFSGDLQEWIRNERLQPDWLRVGTDIVGGATPPTFDAAFSLSGTTVTPNFTFTTGSPDGRMATASQPSVGGQTEIESADDFILANETNLTQATVTGLLPAGINAGAITDVRVEIYRVFPFDSNPSRTIKVPTRTNSPSDIEFTDRDSSNGSLSFGFDVLNPSFTAANSELAGIHPAPHQTTGGDGPVTGEEAQFQITFNTPLDLPAGHYFFVPQVRLSNGGHFYWLSTPSKQFSGDLQEWIRNQALQPDWLRVGTDIVGGATPPTFDAAFSLSGQ